MKHLKALLSPLLFTCLIACNNAGDDSEANNRDTATTNTEAKTDNTAVNPDTSSNISSTKLDRDDEGLVKDMVESNYAEIKLAQVAQTKSTNQEIKEIAQMLERDHTEALNKLKRIASAKSVDVATAETDKARKDIEKMNERDTDKFDKEWCNELMDKHDKTIKRLEKEQNDAADPDVKNWINEVLPKIRAHHDRLMAFSDKLKK